MSTTTKSKRIRGILITILALFMLILGVVAIYIHNIHIPLDSTKLSNISPTVVILDSQGNQIDESLLINNSHYISIDNIPQHTIDAFVSVEDKRFFQHNGLDYRRIAGAIISNIKAGSFKEGASTITQQLIKNTHLDNDKTIERKISEQMLALELEQKYSKLQILEMYLNTIYFGCNAYGIESASLCYFDKSAKQLSLSESATLAGMIKAPNTYNPNSDIDKCTTRRNLVLLLMLEQGNIDTTQYDNAINSPIECIPSTSNDYGYMYGVVQQACQILNMTPAQLANSSLTISTYYDNYAQQCLDNALQQQMETLDNANGTVLMCNNNNSGIIALSSYGKYMADSCRQVGSAIKPIAVYAPAIDMGKLTSASLILDEQSNFAGYKPSNYNNKYYGWVTATDAIAKSMNIPAVKILNSIGVDNSCEYLNSMGIDACDQDLSMALGNVSCGMSISQLAQCYTTLANNGKCNNASYIASIDNKQGNIYTNTTLDNQVFDSSSAYITTNMLQYTVSNGTASRLKNLPYDIACKTGTVGTSSYNTDALSCAYTNSNTIVSWITGELDNSITGGTLPTQIIADALLQYYDNNSPDDFIIPTTVTMKSLDNNELAQNQKMLLAGNHTTIDQQRTFPFATDTAPIIYSQRPVMPQLDVHMLDETISIRIDTIYDVELHRIFEDCDSIISTDMYTIDNNIVQGNTYSYYAIISKSGYVVGTTPYCTITIPNAENKPTEEDSYSTEEKSYTPITIEPTPTSPKQGSLLDIFYIGRQK